jgi:hypothetical protein
MSTCPNCGADLKEARKASKASAKEIVEGLRLEADLFQWCAEFCDKNVRTWSASWLQQEMDAFKDRLRANGYRTNAGPVKDARAAFRTHLRNAVKFASRGKEVVRPVVKRPEKKDV